MLAGTYTKHSKYKCAHAVFVFRNERWTEYGKGLFVLTRGEGKNVHEDLRVHVWPLKNYRGGTGFWESGPIDQIKSVTSPGAGEERGEGYLR